MGNEPFQRLLLINFNGEIREISKLNIILPSFELNRSIAEFVAEKDRKRLMEVVNMLAEDEVPEIQAVFRFVVRFSQISFLFCHFVKAENLIVVSVTEVNDMFEGSHSLLQGLEEQYNLNNEIADAVAQIQNHFLEELDPKKGFHEAIKQLTDVSGSEFGFIAEKIEGGNGAYLQVHAVYQTSENLVVNKFFEKEMGEAELEFHSLDNLFGKAVTEERIIISNDPKSDPDAKGQIPWGHPKLKSFLGVPLVFGEEVVGVLALANRKYGYDKDFLWTYSRLLELSGILIQASRQRRNALETERRFIEAQATAGIGTWYLNLSDGKISWSKEMFRIFNRDPKLNEPTSADLLSSIHLDDQKMWLEAWARTVKEFVSSKILFRAIHQNGDIVWVEAIAQALVVNNRTVAVHGTCQDVTEMVYKNQQIEIERSKAVQASKLSTLGEMASGVAHEINNPLAIISGYSKKILGLLENEEVNKQKLIEVARRIDKAVDRVSQIVTGLNSFSRDGSLGEKEQLSVLEVLDEALTFCRNRFKNKGVDLRLSGNMSEQIFANKIPISQILLNLLNNAFDAVSSSDYSWVDLQCRNTGDGFVEIRVTDSGKGIPPEIRERILEPFFTTKEVGKGTGLGLSISKGIAEDHGGSLSIDSKSPNTCFVLKLPEAKYNLKSA